MGIATLRQELPLFSPSKQTESPHVQHFLNTECLFLHNFSLSMPVNDRFFADSPSFEDNNRGPIVKTPST